MTDDLYHEQLLDLAQQPHHSGTLDQPDHVWHGFNASCGDEVTIFVKFSPDGQQITNLTWQGQGCVISQAAMSVVADLAQGKTRAELEKLTFEQILAGLGLDQVSPGRVRCVTLGWQTILQHFPLQKG